MHRSPSRSSIAAACQSVRFVGTVATGSKLPGCEFAERTLEARTLNALWYNVEERYHGDHHALVGGVTDCHTSVHDELAGYAHNSTVMQYAADIMISTTVLAAPGSAASRLSGERNATLWGGIAL